MLRLFNSIAFLLISFSAFAQYDDDSVFVVQSGKGWVIPYTAQKDETVFMVARRYHVPPVILAGNNNVEMKSTLSEGKEVQVPIAVYNLLKDKPNEMTDALPLYYRVQENDNLARISKNSQVSQQIMERWNHLPDNVIYVGNVLFVGWVLFDATSGGKRIVVTTEGKTAATEKAKPAAATDTRPMWPDEQPYKKNIYMSQAQAGQQEETRNRPRSHDTVIIIKPAKDTVKRMLLEQDYLNQTANEQKVNEEKGSAVFFASGKKGTRSVFYALHNTAARGTVIKVHNPGNDKTIYVKVIGTIPDTKQYHNAVIAISGDAKQELGVEEDKFWAELSHF